MKISPELQNDWQQLKKGQLKWLIIKSQVAGDESAPLVTDASGDANSTHDQLWARVPKVVYLTLSLSLSARFQSIFTEFDRPWSVFCVVHYSVPLHLFQYPVIYVHYRIALAL